MFLLGIARDRLRLRALPSLPADLSVQIYDPNDFLSSPFTLRRITKYCSCLRKCEFRNYPCFVLQADNLFYFFVPLTLKPGIFSLFFILDLLLSFFYLLVCILFTIFGLIINTIFIMLKQNDIYICHQECGCTCSSYAHHIWSQKTIATTLSRLRVLIPTQSGAM